MKKKITVAVLIVNYNGKQYLEDCLRSLSNSSYSEIEQVIFLVDNNSTDGSKEYVRSHWPDIRIITNINNTGYSGGNVLGWDTIVREIPDIEYIYLLNQDTIVHQNFLEPIVRVMENDRSIGTAQSLLRLYPETDKINSDGNIIHFLGFGYSGNCGEARESISAAVKNINYASGAAMMVRVSAIQDEPLFDPEYFMYLEDLDLGWRMLLQGKRNVLVPESIVDHKFQFSRGMSLYYYFERNRIWIVLKNYKVLTLLCIFPAFLIMECGQLLYAALHGNIRDKLKSYVYFFRPRSISRLLNDRKVTQSKRTVSDKQIFSQFTGAIEFQPIANPLITYIANPVFSVYGALLKRIMMW